LISGGKEVDWEDRGKMAEWINAGKGADAFHKAYHLGVYHWKITNI